MILCKYNYFNEIGKDFSSSCLKNFTFFTKLPLYSKPFTKYHWTNKRFSFSKVFIGYIYIYLLFGRPENTLHKPLTTSDICDLHKYLSFRGIIPLASASIAITTTPMPHQMINYSMNILYNTVFNWKSNVMIFSLRVYTNVGVHE